MRQEIDGPQAKQIKDRDHIFLILEVKETFPTIHQQKSSSEVKRGVISTYP